MENPCWRKLENLNFVEEKHSVQGKWKSEQSGLNALRDAPNLGHLQYLIQRVAPSEEAEHLIIHGWKFVGVLPNGKAVIENSETV